MKSKSKLTMARQAPETDLRPFLPLPHCSDEINRNVVQSEIEGGVYLRDLTEGAALKVQTENRFYTIVNRGGGQALISGHPEFCPEPVEVSIHGSTWGGSVIRSSFIGRGMHLEFGHPARRGCIITSPIVEVHEKR